MDTIRHLVVNPELYAPIFMTDNNSSFEMIQNHVNLIVPQSKIKVFYHNFQQILFIYQEYYTKALDDTKLFLKQNNLEKGVSWFTKNAIAFPCGYYQIGIAYLKDQNSLSSNELPENVKNYFKKSCDFLKTNFFLHHDYLTNSYGFALKGDRYEDLTLKFNDFILENGLGPFDTVSEVSIYGEMNGRNYPRLAKRI